MTLKRIMAILLALCLMLTFAACGGDPAEGGETTTTTTTAADVDATGSQSGGGRTTTSRAGYQTNSRPNQQGYVGRAVTIKEGTLPLIYTAPGVKRNFGGKTYTYATINSTQKHKDMIRAYEKEYNVKIKETPIAMNVYVEKTGAAKAAGTPYDIAFIYDTWYPQQITQGLLEPIDPYITTADLWDGKHPEKGGFSRGVLEGMAWNNHAYAAGGAWGFGIQGFYYNKKMFKQAGQPDLTDLYQKGQLTWEKMYEIGSKMLDVPNKKYFIQNFANYYNASFVVTYGTDFAVIKDGLIKENLSDKTLATALEMFKKFTAGEGRLTDRTPKADEQEHGIEGFVDGSTAVIITWPAAFTSIDKQIRERGTAFDKNPANVGWCPLPQQNATKTYVKGSAAGTAIGAGTSDPYVALTFCHWNSIHNIEGAYVDAMPESMRKISIDALNKDNSRVPISGFESSAGSISAIRGSICRAVASGADVASTLKAYKKQLQRVIDSATK